ncbi:hypothetical protein HYN48_04325 [Flavobacterium magnum]|uniref:Fibronectin type-III domain-containing protein n=1 Tax=Flavobacterium magnum TaxID=2162713 RepID=A0A2S0RCK6_9FLAO|nr:gliding motility-associated C-terminal domain-containing protein [Flavobacterium magnum]AWA29374.1 hypothetical protein HYN48_04325 [Flavobacterium magnum]
MKKIILLFTFLLCSMLGFSQLETFEGGIPSTWAVMNGTNGVGAAQPWILNTTPFPVNRSPYAAHNDTTPPTLNAAYVNREQIGAGNTEEDWLIMNQRQIPANGQLQFWTRLTQIADQGTIYEIRVSTNASQTNQAAYTVLKTWGEDEIIDPTLPIGDYQQVKVDFPVALQGQNVYIAFVRKFTQETGQIGGDRWLIDDVNIVEKCADVTGLDFIPASIASTHVTFTWANPQLSTSFELGVVPAADDFNFVGTPVTVAATNPATYAYSGAPLTPDSTFKVYVRRVCGTGSDTTYSEWAGPFIFTTLPLGSVCIDPLVIPALPYQELNDNTALYGDEVDTAQAANCGTVTPANANYLQGNEVFYSVTATSDVPINVVMTPLGNSPNSSVFVYEGCIGNGGTCLGGVANNTLNVRNFVFNAVSGHTYTIIVSSSTTQPIAYGLLVQEVKCTPMPANLAASPVTTTNAHLTWDAQSYSSWQVAVQPLGTEVPSGDGVAVATNEYDAPVVAATQYQYWVRAECAPGTDIWTPWAGPFPFNSDICEPEHKCNYTFRIGNNGPNGWGNDTVGSRMQIRQNGIVIATLGSQLATGAGPVDVIVPICEGVPFDVFWSKLGSTTQQRQLTIINNHGQTIFTRPAVAGVLNSIVYSDVIAECDTPRCDLTPTNVTIPTASITTTGATINWTAVATTSWDIYIAPVGSPAPDADTVPTYDNITGATTSFTTTDPLQPDHCYEVYVRVNCSPNPSAWSALTADSDFCTLPTCQKPVNPQVTVLSTTAATFTWTPALPAQTDFEILLIPGPNPPSPAPDNVTPATYPIITVPVGGPYTFTATDLTPATIYYGYVRAVCSPTDASVWVPFNVFNSVTCEPVDKCVYKFVLTDIGGGNGNGNGWGNSRMQVRQNGILIQELNLPSGGNATVQVPLCDGVPFDLFWSIAGQNPEQIGVSIQNPFLDVLFTKAPGTGTPSTVLYSSVVECSPAPCSKPTDITVATATILPHSAVITWTDNSNPPSDGYELYVVNTGDPAPTNDPPTPANVTGITGTSYTLTNINGVPLSASTSYTFYIRAVCPGSQVSTWTILTPVTFITTPENNECAFATPVTVNTGIACDAANMATGNTYGANASNPVVSNDMTGAGCEPTAKDVWYSFVATSTSQTIVLSDIVPKPATPGNFKLNYSVFSGSCTGLTRMFCSTTNTNGGTGFIPGNTYYIRVYNAPSVPATQSATFHLCVLTPPTNDECINATPVTVNTGQTCAPANTVSANTFGSTASNPSLTPPLAGTGCGPTSNDIWFSFVAVAPTQIINISNVVSTPANVANLKINYSVFSGSCGALTNLYCSTATASIATGLTVGNIYYIRAYIAPSNSEQSATFDLCITSPPANDECTAAVTVPVNASQYCDAVTSGNTLGATPSNPVLDPVLTGPGCGVPNNDLWYSFTATSTTHMISISNVVPTPATATNVRLNYSVFSGSCGVLVKKYCSTNYISMATGLVPGEVYYIRVYTATTAVDTSATFDLCITSPPSNNECANAISVTPNTGQDCAPVNTVSGYTYGATASLPVLTPPLTGAGCLQANSDIWYSFTASSTSHAITLSNIVRSPSNSTANLNYGVFSGTCDNLTKLYCSTTNSSNATGLTVGQTYYIRVYSTSTSVDQSIKFDLCITSPPVNDDCANAIEAPVNPTSICTDKAYGNTLGATQSTPTITGTGCIGTNDDVWFKFTATNAVHFINVDQLFASSGSVSLHHTLFSGTCDALTTMYCSTAANSVATGLTVGQVYYVRVYTAGTAVGDWSTFSLCVKTPPPPAENEDCSSATAVTVNLNNDCLYTTPGNLIEAGPSTGTPNSPACTGNANDDVWFSFVATSNQHFINLLNVEGTTSNLNHAVYSGNCNSLTRLYCSDANSLNSTSDEFVVGETYYIRVWSNAPTSQIVIFDLCVKSVSTCETATPFCGSQAEQSLLFTNTTGVTPGLGPIACLGSSPNPTFYYLQVGQTGALEFEIRQSTDPNNFPTTGAPGIDVDYVAWGPFTSPSSCDQVAFEDCPSCQNNTTPGAVYPQGNILDCSYDGAPVETLHIPNAVAGEYYLLMITNFNQAPGYIKLFQSNFGEPGTGVSTNLCCDVAAGDDITACGASITLDALADSTSSPSSYQWYLNETLIPGAESSTYDATQSGIYKVVGICGLNQDVDYITVTLLPAIGATTPADYVLCDGDDADGQAPFNLLDVTSQVLVGLVPTDYSVSYHLTADAAANDEPGIDLSTDFLSPTQTIYVRVERISLPTCYEVIPVNLVVTSIDDATITYEAQYCSDAGTISPLTVVTPGTFTATGGLNIAADGTITLTGSEEGLYTITNTTAGACSDTKTADITIVRRHTAGFNYGTAGTLYCKDGGTVSPQFTGNFSQAGTFTVVDGDGNLSIDPNTGQITLATSDAGDYTIKNVVDNGPTCSGDEATATITIVEAATGTIAYNGGPFCKDVTSVAVQNLVTPVSDAGTYSVDIPGLSIGADGTINPSASQANDYVVTYTLDIDGCGIYTTQAAVTIVPESNIEFTAECSGNDFVITALPVNGSFNPALVTYNWTGGTFVSGTATGSIIAKAAPATYTVEVVADGCSTFASIDIDDISCIIQRGISPNNDTKNDSFDLTTLNVKHLSIFNRYGTVVYEFTNYTNQWVGQDNSGDELPDGTYFYVIDKADGEQKTGWVYINR